MQASDETGADMLLKSEIRVINIGLREFAHNLEASKVAFVHVNWSPPAVNNPKIKSLLDKLGG